MGVFTKKPKKSKEELAAEQKAKEQAEYGDSSKPAENVNIKKDAASKPVEKPTLAQLIVNNPDVWYKEQVLNGLITINAQLENLNERLKALEELAKNG